MSNDIVDNLPSASNTSTETGVDTSPFNRTVNSYFPDDSSKGPSNGANRTPDSGYEEGMSLQQIETKCDEWGLGRPISLYVCFIVFMELAHQNEIKNWLYLACRVLFCLLDSF